MFFSAAISSPPLAPINATFTWNVLSAKQSRANAIKWTKYFLYPFTYAWISMFILHVGYLCHCYCFSFQLILLPRISSSWQNLWAAGTSITSDCFVFCNALQAIFLLSKFGFLYKSIYDKFERKRMNFLTTQKRVKANWQRNSDGGNKNDDEYSNLQKCTRLLAWITTDILCSRFASFNSFTTLCVERLQGINVVCFPFRMPFFLLLMYWKCTILQLRQYHKYVISRIVFQQHCLLSWA